MYQQTPLPPPPPMQRRTTAASPSRWRWLPYSAAAGAIIGIITGLAVLVVIFLDPGDAEADTLVPAFIYFLFWAVPLGGAIGLAHGIAYGLMTSVLIGNRPNQQVLAVALAVVLPLPLILWRVTEESDLSFILTAWAVPALIGGFTAHRFAATIGDEARAF